MGIRGLLLVQNILDEVIIRVCGWEGISQKKRTEITNEGARTVTECQRKPPEKPLYTSLMFSVASMR